MMTTEFKMVPVETLKFALGLTCRGFKSRTDQEADKYAALKAICELLAAPASPQAAQPVAEVVATGGPHDKEDRVLVELQAELPPVGTKLYAHADAGEVKRLQLRDRIMTRQQISLREAVGTLRAQLAERDALLRDIRQSCELSKLRDAQIDAALSTTAKPEADHE